MSRSAQWLSVVAVVFLTSAITIAFGPQSPGSVVPDTTSLWVVGILGFIAAVFVDTELARRQIPFLRSAAADTQRRLGTVAHEGQKLLGRLNGYQAFEPDEAARRHWESQVQVWTDWAARIIGWRLPDLLDNFANEAGRFQADFHETPWKHNLATWLEVRMQRLNELIRDADRHRRGLGPRPKDVDLEIPNWVEPPDPRSSPNAG